MNKDETEGRTIWNSDGTDGPCLICPPPAATRATTTVAYNKKHDGIEVKFNDKPPASTRERLQAAGFRWSKFQKLWYRKFTGYAWAQAHTIADVPLPDTSPKPLPDSFDMAVEDRMAEITAFTR